MSVVEELGAAVRQVKASVGAAVVGVGREGSGVVIAQGLVATNAHNLRGGAPTVVFEDGRTAEAEVAAVDVDGDVAVLKVDTGSVAAPAWMDSEAQVGDVVFGVANPGGTGVRV